MKLRHTREIKHTEEIVRWKTEDNRFTLTVEPGRRHPSEIAVHWSHESMRSPCKQLWILGPGTGVLGPRFYAFEDTSMFVLRELTCLLNNAPDRVDPKRIERGARLLAMAYGWRAYLGGFVHVTREKWRYGREGVYMKKFIVYNEELILERVTKEGGEWPTTPGIT